MEETITVMGIIGAIIVGTTIIGIIIVATIIFGAIIGTIITAIAQTTQITQIA